MLNYYAFEIKKNNEKTFQEPMSNENFSISCLSVFSDLWFYLKMFMNWRKMCTESLMYKVPYSFWVTSQRELPKFMSHQSLNKNFLIILWQKVLSWRGQRIKCVFIEKKLDWCNHKCWHMVTFHFYTFA